MKSTPRILPDADSLARTVAELFVTLAVKAIAARGRFTVALAGGSTPESAYGMLATSEFAARVGWSFVHIFWGDERCVPPHHPDSNYSMARKSLLDHVPLPVDNLHRMRGEIEPEKAALDYERRLRSFFARPRLDVTRTKGRKSTLSFDLVLLGMGNDGHIASLFPGTRILREKTRWVVAHYVETLKA